MMLKSQKRIDIDHGYGACLKTAIWQSGSGNILSDKKNPLNPYLLIHLKVAIKYLQKGSLNCRQDEGELSELDTRGQRRFGSSTEMKEFVKDPSRESSDHRRDEGECDGPTDKP